MAFKLVSRVRETTSTTGTGSYSLSGAFTGHKAFGTGYSNGDTFFALISMGANWELIKGTYGSSGNTVARTQVYKSTNSNNAVNWGSGVKEIMVVWPAPSDLDAAGRLLLQTELGLGAGGFGYSNLRIAVNSNTQVGITARRLSVEDSSGIVRWLSSVSLTATITSSGANGRDTGSETSSTWYFVYVIYNPTTGATASLLSISATSPTLPSGYTFSVRVGAVRNDASSNLISTIQRGNIAQYVGVGPAFPVSLSVDDFSLTDYVPSTAVAVNALSYWSAESSQFGSAGPNASVQFGATALGQYVPSTFLIETAATMYAARLGQFVGWIDGL